VEAFKDAAEAARRAETCDFLILDTLAEVYNETLAVARMAHLVVQPTWSYGRILVTAVWTQAAALG
jgi:hypothetical protein